MGGSQVQTVEGAFLLLGEGGQQNLRGGWEININLTNSWFDG